MTHTCVPPPAVAKPLQNNYACRNCPACGSTRLTPESVSSVPQAEHLPFEELLHLWDTNIFTTKGYFTYRRCADCGLLYTPIYPSDSQLGTLYGSMKPNMSELPLDSMRSTQRGYLHSALSHHPPPRGSILEIGPDQGILATQISQDPSLTPSHFWFIEPNRAVHPLLQASVSPISCTLFSDLNDFSTIPSATASLAFMIHVLDHLTNPLHHLRELFRCLQPGGILSIVVHNEKSLQGKLFGPNHPIYCPYHPQLFNPKTLAALVSSAGFHVLSVTPTLNHYPFTFLLKNALFRLTGTPPSLPEIPWLNIPFPLGNIQINARKSTGTF